MQLYVTLLRPVAIIEKKINIASLLQESCRSDMTPCTYALTRKYVEMFHVLLLVFYKSSRMQSFCSLKQKCYAKQLKREVLQRASKSVFQ